MRWRLVAVFVGITVVVLAVHDIPLARHLRTVERDRLVTALERDAFTLAGRSEEALEAADPDEIDITTALLVDYRTETGGRVVVTDATGRAVMTSDEEITAGRDYSTRPEIATALGGTPTSGERESATLGQRLLYVAVPVLSGQAVVGSVRITYPSSVIDERVESRVQGLLMVALISVVVAAAAAMILAATVTRPLRRVRAATEEMAAGDLSVRAPAEDGPPEVRSLAASFNVMGERLQRMVARQRAFAGDASHQLRTPLTALRLRLEQANDLLEDDPAEARRRLDAAADETERLQHLVEGLLILARAEGRTEARELVDVSSVARERAEVWQALAEEQGIDLRVDVRDGLTATAIPGAVEQIVDNYVDNALTHAPAGSTVEVRVHRQGPSVVVEVADRGPGMDPEQRERAFDRFWRADDAPSGGTGLGLAIVRQLADASGGAAAVRAREGGGLVAEVRLLAAER